jgi:hypothetical protein
VSNWPRVDEVRSCLLALMMVVIRDVTAAASFSERVADTNRRNRVLQADRGGNDGANLGGGRKAHVRHETA